MMTQTRNPAMDEPADAPTQFATLAEMNGKNLEIAQTAGATAIQHALDASQETAQFMSTRLKKDVATLQTMAGCRSIGDVIQRQADFFGDMLQDYAVQTARMVQLGAHGAANTVQAFTDLTPVKDIGGRPENIAPARADRNAG